MYTLKRYIKLIVTGNHIDHKHDTHVNLKCDWENQINLSAQDIGLK